jgi:hypothetical protein
MNTLLCEDWTRTNRLPAREAKRAHEAGYSSRETLATLRDFAVMLGLDLVVRASFTLQKLNY